MRDAAAIPRPPRPLHRRDGVCLRCGAVVDPDYVVIHGTGQTLHGATKPWADGGYAGCLGLVVISETAVSEVTT